MTQPISCQGYSTFFTFSIIEVHFIAALVKAAFTVHGSLFPKQEFYITKITGALYVYICFLWQSLCLSAVRATVSFDILN